MTEILQSPPQLVSSQSPIDNDGLLQQTHLSNGYNTPNSYPVAIPQNNTEEEREGSLCVVGVRDRKRREREEEEEREGNQLSLLAVLVTVFRKSLVACTSERFEEFSSSTSTNTNTTTTTTTTNSMEIGLPTDVRHVAHVTFDRFNGFLGLPVEFEPEVPRRPPSASTSVFGVSTESMQLSFDSRGNSVPTILLMMQRRLYTQGGLQAEGIFRINGENGQEEYVREQLNKGEVPENIDVHCLAGLIKAWFRELPNGVLDTLAPEQVMQAQSEEECTRLVRLLPPTEASLMDWALNLMADVAQLEHLNKMNARNIAMVFAPNMTQMDDPLTALMYAVQVMNFLKTLIVKTLREREDSIVEPDPTSRSEPSDKNGPQNSSELTAEETNELNKEDQHVFLGKEPVSESQETETETSGFLTSIENFIQSEKGNVADNRAHEVANKLEDDGEVNIIRKIRNAQTSNSNHKKGSRNGGNVGKSRGTTTIVSRLNSRTERIEAWR